MPVKWIGILAAHSLKFLGLTFFSFLVMSGLARAETPLLEMTMNKTELIRLDQSAASVIVTNPAHVSVTLDNPRLLILTPHAAGVTSMIVLDAAGKTIMQRDIAVSNVKQKYVRVRRMCTGNDASCTASSYDYCPDGCYEVTEVPPNMGGSVTPPP